MATVLITGGTGLIGTALTKALLQRGHSVIILTRRLPKQQDQHDAITYALWDVDAQTIDAGAVGRADYLVHLAGANVAEGRWTEQRKSEIVSSRVMSGKLLVSALSKTPNKIQAVIASSAIGWYGPDPQVPNPKPFKEEDPADSDFLGHICKLWEESIRPVEDLGKRLVILRTGIVLSRAGGAYKEFRKPLQFGVAGILGNGRQVVSWIHIDDIVGMYLTAIENVVWKGVFNGVAPGPVNNRELVLAIAKAKGGFYLPAPVPAAALRLALGEMSIEVLKSTTVSCAKAVAAGFSFQYPGIKQAATALEQQ